MQPYQQQPNRSPVPNFPTQSATNATLQAQFRAAEDYARQQYLKTLMQRQLPDKTINPIPPNPRTEYHESQNQTNAISHNIASSVANNLIGRFGYLENQNAPRTMEYINDHGGLHPQIQPNSFQRTSIVKEVTIAPSSQRRLNSNYHIPNVGVDVDPSFLQKERSWCERYGLDCCGCFGARGNSNVVMPVRPSTLASRPPYSNGSCCPGWPCCNSEGSNQQHNPQHQKIESRGIIPNNQKSTCRSIFCQCC